ncbi:MAG: hypothetical protein AAFS11_04090 [Planctomycetota bacterium]
MTAPKQIDSAERFRQIAEMADAVHEQCDLIEIRPLKLKNPDRPRGGRSLVEELRQWVKSSQIVDALRGNDYDGIDMYLGINPRTVEGGGSKEHVELCRNLVVDIDKAGLSRAMVYQLLEDHALPPPTALLSTGRGWHYWGRLEDAISPGLWSAHQLALISKINDGLSKPDWIADHRVTDPSRLLRIPGFTNYTWDQPVELVDVDPLRVYSLDEFPVPASTSTIGTIPIIPLPMMQDGVDGASPDEIAEIFDSIPISAFGQSNNRIFKIAKLCRARVKTDEPPDWIKPIATEHWREHRDCMNRTWLEYWIEFCRSWGNVRDGVGELAAAAMVAKTMLTPRLITEASGGEDNGSSLAWLANLMIVLQVQAGDTPIWLDQREAGVVLGGLSRQRISQLISVILKLGGAERVYDGHTGKASEYLVKMKPVDECTDKRIA